MGEVTALKKIQVAVMAAIIAMAMGFTLSLGTQAAYAGELQASGIDLSAQSQMPVVNNVKQKTIYPGQTVTITLKNTLEGQDGTWKVTSSNAKIAKVTKYTNTSEKSTKVTIKGVKAGTATITAKYTNINDMSDNGTAKIKVTGVAKGKTFGTLAYKAKATAHSKTSNTGTMAITGVKKVPQNRTAYNIPDTKKVKGRTYKVTAINSKALTGLKSAKKLTVGKNVKKLGASMISGDKNLKTVVLHTTKLTKSSVKNSLKGSSVKTVKVPSSMVAKYKKIFTKANCGVKVTVKSL